MPKPKTETKNKATPDFPPVVSPDCWSKNHGTYLAGRAALDGVDAMAADMERRWGCGRLRLLVAVDLREKFDRQRYLLAQARLFGTLEEVRVQSARMATAYTALDIAAISAGAAPLDVAVFEVTLDDGSVAAIVNHGATGMAMHDVDRAVAVFTIEEIGKLLSHYSAVVQAKLTWPGATVEKISRIVPDPLDTIRDPLGLDTPLDDELDDLFVQAQGGA